MKKISFIIPCYNEEESLPILYQRLNNVANQLNNYKGIIKLTFFIKYSP